jgi:hypothetical protein
LSCNEPLEAIHLHCNPGDGQLPLRINESRGIEPTTQSLEEVSSWLFFDRQPAHKIEIVSQSDQGEPRELTIALLDRVALREQFPQVDKMLGETFRSEMGDVNQARLVLRYCGPRGEEGYGFCMATALNGFAYTSPRIPPGIPCVFLNSAAVTSADDVKRFGELEGAKRQEEILPALRILEPRLQRLSLILFAGKPCIHGDVGLSRMIPVPLMGEGLRRLLSIVLAIAETKGGVVLIDEIENGLHYSIMKPVWKAIAQAARQADVQVFATTHSWECIRWAHDAFAEEDEYDLRLHRLSREGDSVTAVSYDQARIESALYNAVEMR